MIWLLAVGYHREGHADAAYVHFGRLKAAGRLLPDRDDMLAFVRSQAPTLARSLLNDAPGLVAAAREHPGMIQSGIIGGRVRVRVVCGRAIRRCRPSRSAFGFQGRVRIGETHRAQLRVGSDGAVVVADVRADQVPPSDGVVTHLVKVRVADVDAAFARARDVGARVLQEPTTHEYGERSCVLADLVGHRWELAQTVRDVEPEKWGGTTVAPW